MSGHWKLSEHGIPITVTQPDDPAYALLKDGYTSTPTPGVHRDDCYICEDPEFAQMGLPLCHPCPRCQSAGRTGHIAADDSVCWDCGYDMFEGEDLVRDHSHERGHADGGHRAA